MSSLPAVVSGLLGIFAGMIIRRDDLSNAKRVGYLVLAGLVCLGLGWAWGLQFPIIKKLWTSSFVLFAGGWSFLLVALFYLIIDVWNLRLWSRPFVWIGMNCITIYMLRNLVGGFNKLVGRVVHPPVVDAMGEWGDLVVTILGLLIAFAICRYLYFRKIFLRV